MANKGKYYYIDSDGNKKKYIGKIISNNGSYNGILTTVTTEKVKKPLEYHPEVIGVEGYSSYYTYVNNLGEETLYYDIIKRDSENNLYFSYNERFLYNLKYHEEVSPKEEYYTYIDSFGNECRFTGNVIYDRATDSYSGFIDKKK